MSRTGSEATIATRVTVAAIAVVVFGALAGLIIWVGNTKVASCASICGSAAPAAREPMTSAATPPDGLFDFGALQSVWNYSHPLVDPDSWGEFPEGYRSAVPTARGPLVILTLVATPRIIEMQVYFSISQDNPTDVEQTQGRALIEPELPPDSTLVRPSLELMTTGCVTADLYLSRTLQAVLGDVYIRVEYDSDLRTSMTMYKDAMVRTVPVSDPCELVGT